MNDNWASWSTIRTVHHTGLNIQHLYGINIVIRTIYHTRLNTQHLYRKNIVIKTVHHTGLNKQHLDIMKPKV